MRRTSRARLRDRRPANGCTCRSSTRRAPSRAGTGRARSPRARTVDVHRPRLALDLFALARELVQAGDHRPSVPTPSAAPAGDVTDEPVHRAPHLVLRPTGMALRSSTAPAASSVSVATPNATTPRYSLVVSCRNRSRRVTRPRPTSSTPVASGSSVPAWPIRLLPAHACAASRRRRARSNPRACPRRGARRSRHARAQRGCDRRSRRSRPSDVNPAANRCPPPPCATAIRCTSAAPTDRRLTLTVPSGSSLSTHATSASAVRRTMSMRPSTSSTVTS